MILDGKVNEDGGIEVTGVAKQVRDARPVRTVYVAMDRHCGHRAREMSQMADVFVAVDDANRALAATRQRAIDEADRLDPEGRGMMGVGGE